MNLTQIILFLAIGIGLGFAISLIFQTLINRSIIKSAEEEASEIIKESQDLFQAQELERAERTQEIELELWSNVEDAHLAIEEKCTELDEKIQIHKKNYEESDKLQRQVLMNTENDLRLLSMKLNDHQSEFQKTTQNLLSLKDSYKKDLLQKTQLTESDISEQIKSRFISECESDRDKQLESLDNDLKDFSEAKAKRILALVIERFAKEMSTERHISSTFFPNEKVRSLFCQKLSENVAMIQDLTGCDILIDPQPDPERLFNVQVVGYDPVRRELTRRIFEKIFRDTEKSHKPTEPSYIKRVGESLKVDLIKQIKKDGDLLSKELGLSDLHPEIKQVMGSLRYRYSYTQNQYFHCGEVGWFASLIAQELKMSKPEVNLTKRSGFLHDLGKALDHEFDGSHAVIGADFIQQRNENPEVIHAVRAHHYDVQPENPMDFIVIAADAISGGRPGARRSTMETYNQKVTGLQEIARRFKGVTDIFVLNGGRECRVLVNSRIIDDAEAMTVSQQIAKTIEEEMQYPGQIKVVVVRETVVSESRHVENKKGDHRQNDNRQHDNRPYEKRRN